MNTALLLLILALAIGAVDPQSNATLYGQIALGVVVIVQIAMQIFSRREDRRDREQQRRFDEEDRERRAREVRDALVAEAKRVEDAAIKTVQHLEEKLEENTSITKEGFHEMNNFKAREKELMESFAAQKTKLEIELEKKTLQDVKVTGEDTNVRVKNIETEAAEVAEVLRKKEAGE